ncbi:MAG: four helix bundle protein [Planctomycetes bacterium]|nr:four helix bundle protein [Planctomycetota bacterium]
MPPSQPLVLHFEKLHVYHKALDLVSLVHSLRPSWPSGYSSLFDQLFRASTSIVLNIAEGAGEFSPREKARFYRMALRSTTESAAAIDISLRVAAISENGRGSARQIFAEIISMLTRLVQVVEKGRKADEAPGK